MSDPDEKEYDYCFCAACGEKLYDVEFWCEICGKKYCCTHRDANLETLPNGMTYCVECKNEEIEE